MPIGPQPMMETFAPLMSWKRLAGVDGDGQRLDERGFVVGHGIGNDVDLRGIDREIFAGRAGGLEAHDLQLGAEVIFAVRAGIALPAGDLRLEHDLLPDFEALDRAADLDNLAGDFVALRYGIFGIRVFAVVDVDIRAADAEAHHFDQNLIVADLGDGHVAEFNYTRGCHNFLQHYNRSFSAETFGWIGLINSDFIDPCFFAAIGGKDMDADAVAVVPSKETALRRWWLAVTV